ncbi:MAG: HlyD family efflux transporter periplasmic adaptor subunit [Bacillota bacterium]
MARVKVRARFFVLMTILAAAVLLLIVIFVSNGNQGDLGTGTIDMNGRFNAVVIRDEVLVTTERYDRVIYKVEEGSFVESGAPVAQVFQWGYNDDIMQALLNVQKQILTEQLAQLSGIENAELDGYNTQIAAKEAQIRSLALSGTGGDLLSLELELKDLSAQRREYLRSSVQQNESLTELYQKETELTDQLNQYRSDIVATDSGRISFYFDGYEQALDATKLDLLTSELVGMALKGTGAGNTTITENLLYRLADNQHAYIAFLTKASSPLRVVEGETYTVTFDAEPSTTFAGTALAPIVEQNNVVNILEFHQDIGFLLNARVAAFSLNKSATGVIVPLKAIVFKDQRPGLNIISGEGETQWVEVSVLCANEEQAVVKAASLNDTIVAGLRYKMP